MCSIRGGNWRGTGLRYPACRTLESGRAIPEGGAGMSNCLLRPVDLRLLQRVGVIHVDGLPLGVEVNCADAALAMAVARCLGSAEGQVNFSADGWSIDVGDAGFKIPNRGQGLVHVLRIERRR